MPARPCREVIDDLKTNKKNRTFGELRSLLEEFGFEMHPRTRGSHRAFSRAGCAYSPSIPEVRGSVLAVYVRSVIRALEEVCDD